MKLQDFSFFIVAIVLSLVQAERNIVPSVGNYFFLNILLRHYYSDNNLQFYSLEIFADVWATFPNEDFVIDLTRCQNTYSFHGRTWDCPDNYYKPNGDCYCKAGFTRLTEDGKCVSVKNNAACVVKLQIKPGMSLL